MIRVGIVVALGFTTFAHADPQLETGGFFGLDYFGDRIRLGSAWADQRYTQTSPVFGARLSVLCTPSALAEDEPRFSIGAETELSLTQTFTAGSMSYFAPIIGWRAHALARFGDSHVAIHVVAGGGNETVVSSAPFVKTETEHELYWGLGFRFRVGLDKEVRIDARHGFMADRTGDTAGVFEIQLGFSRTFGATPRLATKPVAEQSSSIVDGALRPIEPRVDRDSDGDGFPDSKDKCPFEAETVNGIDDDDGCPESDPDRDGIVGDADKCPNLAEDFDHFQDSDGCPDPDNDQDGIADAQDRCPNEPETRNGFEDSDGCPDQIPASVTDAFKAAAAVKFETGRARITPANSGAFEKTLEVLRASPDLRIVVIAHPEKPDAADLAKRRAGAVRWYLIGEVTGIDVDRLEARVGDVAGTGPVIELQLLVSPAPPPIAAPVPQAPAVEPPDTLK